MRALLRSLLGRPSRASVAQAARRVRFIEPLESRQMLAAQLAISDSVAPTDNRAIALPDTAVQDLSSAETFTLSNAIGADPLVVSNWAVHGNTVDFMVEVTDANGDPVDTNSNFTIAAGDDYTVTVTFGPTAEGARSATIDFDTNDPTPADATVSLAVSGTGTPHVPAPSVEVTDDSGAPDDVTLNFASTQDGQTSGPLNFTVTNSGDANLDIQNISLTGTDPANFHITILDSLGQTISSPNATVAAGDYITLAVTFAPQDVGNLTAHVAFSTNDTQHANVVLDVAGTGTEAPGGPPAAAKNFSATAVSLGQIDFDWTDVSQIETRYELWEQVGTGAWTRIATLDPNTESYSRTGTKANTTYNYRLRAYNDNGASPIVTDTAKTPKDYAGATPTAAYNLGTITGLKAVRENIGTGDPKDWFKFTLAGAATVRVNMLQLGDDADLGLFKIVSGKTTTIAKSENGGTTAELIQQSLAAGTYYVCTWRGQAGVNTNYRLTVESDFAPNKRAYARNIGTLSGIKTYKDWVGKNDAADYYKFTLGASSAVQLDLTGLSDDADIELLNGSGTVIKVSENPNATPEQIKRTLAAGTYYVRVLYYGDSAGTNYTLRFAV